MDKTMMCDCNIIHEDIVAIAKTKMLPDKELTSISSIFKVLSDPTRAKIVWILDQHEMCVCDLAATLDMTKSAISHQLRALREANLVINRREGKNVFYSLADDHIKQIFEKGLEHIREKKPEE